MRPDFRPFTSAQAVHHGVADGAIAAQGVAADHPVFACAQALNSGLRGEVEIVGAPAHHVASQGLERMGHQQQLAGRVDMGTLRALGVPGVANFDPLHGGQYVVVAAAAQHFAAACVLHHKGEAVARVAHRQGIFNVLAGVFRLGNRRHAQGPQRAVSRCRLQPLFVFQRQRQDAQAVAFQGDGFDKCHLQSLEFAKVKALAVVALHEHQLLEQGDILLIFQQRASQRGQGGFEFLALQHRCRNVFGQQQLEPVQ